jgi:hypothetical protein
MRNGYDMPCEREPVFWPGFVSDDFIVSAWMEIV